MKKKHDLKRLTALCTALFVLATVLIALPLTGSAAEPKIGLITYTVNGTPSPEPINPQNNDKIVAKLQITGDAIGQETDVVLISALYNDQVLSQVQLDKVDPTAAQEGDTLTTTIQVPSTENAKWSYRSFIWNMTSTMTPYEAKGNAIQLQGESSVFNTVTLTWDANDGILTEALDLYRGEDKVTTVGAGLGEWLDYVVADGQTSYSYHLENAAGTRKSNTVTVTPKSADALLESASWADARMAPYAPAGIDKTNSHHQLLEPHDSTFAYDPNGVAAQVVLDKKDPSIADDGPGYLNGTGNTYNGSHFASAVVTPNGEGYTKPESVTLPEDDNYADHFKSPDGESYAWLMTRYYRGGNGWTGQEHNMAFTITKGEYGSEKDLAGNVTEANKIYDGAETKFSVLLEYWGTRTRPFTVQYADSRNAKEAKDGQFKTTTMPVDSNASAQWKVGRVDIGDAYFGYLAPTNGAFHGGNHLAIGGSLQGNEQAYIRKIIILPTEELNEAGDFPLEALFINEDTVEGYREHYTPTPVRKMDDLSAERALKLQATPSVNAVELTWDAVDGNLTDPLQLYCGNQKIADIEAGKGDWVDYMVADNVTQYSYYVQNADGSRRSNTVTVTPKSAQAFLNASAWADANVHPDLINGAKKDVNYHNMSNNGGADSLTISKFYYNRDSIADETAKLSTDFYNGGGDSFFFKNGNKYYSSDRAAGIATGDGVEYKRGESGPNKDQFFRSPDNKSAAYVLALYWRPGKEDNHGLRGSTNLPFIVCPDGVVAENVSLFDVTEQKYSFFVEYWGAQTTPFHFSYYTSTVADGKASNVSANWSDSIPVDGTSEPKWKIARKDVTNAYMGYVDPNMDNINKSRQLQGRSQFDIGTNDQITSDGATTDKNVNYIRKVLVAPTAEVEKLGSFRPEALFYTEANKDEAQYKYTPTRQMQNLSQD